jgi:hypothetical protein
MKKCLSLLLLGFWPLLGFQVFKLALDQRMSSGITYLSLMASVIITEENVSIVWLIKAMLS